jgi:hypothetical protein
MLLQNVRFATRSFRKQPLFCFVIVDPVEALRSE